MNLQKAAPSAKTLIARFKDERQNERGDTALVIPTYKDPKTITKHLEALSKQTTKDFDVVIIYGEDDGFVANQGGLSLVHIKSAKNIGSAGAFFLGQRFCMDEGYGKIILADDDCIPESPDLIACLKEALDKEYAAAPKIRLSPSDRKEMGCIHHYCGLRRETFLKCGFTYLPFFTGGEDFDLMRRILKAGIRIKHIDKVASHPRWIPLFLWKMSKIRSYSKGNLLQILLSDDLVRSTISMSIHIQTAAASLFLGRKGTAKAYFETAWEASGMDFSPPVNNDERWTDVMSGKTFQWDHKISDTGFGARAMEDDAFLQLDGNDPISILIGKSAGTLRENALSSLNKNVLFEGWCNIKDLPTIMLSKGAAIRFEGGTYIICRGRHPIIILLSFFGFLAAIPISIGLGFLLSIRGIANAALGGVSSDGYGLPIVGRLAAPKGK